MSTDKKNKKKLQRTKNRKLFEMLEGFRQIHDEDGRVREQEKERREKKGSAKKADDPIWSEKVSTVRNRLNNQRRTSKERWNRFAGTGDEGGRGL